LYTCTCPRLCSIFSLPVSLHLTYCGCVCVPMRSLELQSNCRRCTL
jgi:hypothetical protein